jgi:hypothetical protein
MNFPRRYIFRGNASGVSAHLRRPEDKILPVQAASSLPVTGGISESTEGPGSLGDYLHYQSAATSAQGDYVDLQAAEAMTRGAVPFDSVPTKTTVTARVRGLNVGKRFSVGEIDAGLVSRSPENGMKQPSIQLVGNRLEDIRVDGSVLKITLNEQLFCDCDTLDKLAAAYAKGLGAPRVGMFVRPDETGRSETLPASGGVVYCTIVESMMWDGKPHPTARVDGNSLVIPDFGRVYFGGLLITDVSRRLTMVRLQLGSPDGGDGSACEVESNGSNWPV